MSDARPDSYHLSPERVLELQHAAILAHGGTPGILKPGCVEGSVAAAESAEFYSKQDVAKTGMQDGLCYASHLFMYLVKNHCFQDGNKRIAWLALVDSLRMFHLTIDESNEVAAAWVDSMAAQHPTVEEVANWLAPRLVVYTPFAAGRTLQPPRQGSAATATPAGG